MSLQEAIARWPLVTALVFEGALIPLALGLALWAGVTPWADLEVTGAAVALGAAGTLPLLLGLTALARLDLPAFRQLEAMVRNVLVRLFSAVRPGGVLLVAALAGLGEELLFRGVIQGWLAEHLPAVAAIAVTSLLFGVAHALNGLYFVIATLVGLYLGVLYHVTGNLFIVVFIHALYDWIVIHVYLRQARAASTPD